MADKTDAWMPLWIGAYLADTQHLSRDEHGAYLLLLMAYWRNDGSLPDDNKRLSAIAKASPKEWKELRPTIAEFFTVADGRWTQKRIEAELALSKEHKNKAVSKAQAAAGARWNKSASNAPSNAPSIPQALLEDMHKECPTPSPLPNTNTEAKASLSSAELPDCPHELLIDLFEKHLPTLAQPKKSLWRAGKNAPAMKARWRWVMTAVHEKGERKGQRLALTKDDAVAWFERYFAYVARSEFLTGTSDDWSCNLGWLVNAANFEKVLAGNYQNKLEAVA